MKLGRECVVCWALGIGLFPGLVIASPPAHGQQQAPAPIERREGQIPTLHVESRLVSVALNVVDENNAPVGGLTVADFEIAEDGKPQKIAVFDKDSATPLQIVLAIDASESVLGDEHLEVQAARSFVRSILRTQDTID
ncbi:MAG TPA: hypothetical protein VLI45_10890, partial [Acidobacteriaceae bacterium]|nr:hypothetical protein [Acidobacteriaceae bacterium]